MHDLSCWIVLCYNGFDGNYRRLCCWLLFDCFVVCLFQLLIWLVFISRIFHQLLELYYWNLPSVNWFLCMHDVHRRIILRDYRS